MCTMIDGDTYKCNSFVGFAKELDFYKKRKQAIPLLRKRLSSVIQAYQIVFPKCGD